MNRICRHLSIATQAKVWMATTGKTTSVAQKLKVGPLKKMYKYMTPGSISLAGGLPMDSRFPFASIDVHLNGGQQFHLDNSKTLLMNYSRGDGIAPLKSWISDHIKQLHNPIGETDSCVTIGSSDAWAKVVQLIDTEAVVYDNFVYGAATNLAEVMGKKSIGVPCDEFGMIPDQLRRSVQEARAKGICVNLIYLIPVGQNPIGITMPIERKEEIYRVCQELDLIIVEDDAYYYLYYEMDDDIESGVDRLPR
jgi:DNA-binding transcriptional MocR family regulator